MTFGLLSLTRDDPLTYSDKSQRSKKSDMFEIFGSIYKNGKKILREVFLNNIEQRWNGTRPVPKRFLTLGPELIKSRSVSSILPKHFWSDTKYETFHLSRTIESDTGNFKEIN